MSQPIRIAFLQAAPRVYTQRLAVGISRFASFSNGYVMREFSLGEEDRVELPTTLKAWNPDAIVTALTSETDASFQTIGANRWPIVSAVRAIPSPHRAVVTGNPANRYKHILSHFHSFDRSRVAQFIEGDNAISDTWRNEYRQFAEENNIPVISFTSANLSAVRDRYEVEPIPERLVEWLLQVPKPIGIFTQQFYVGPYLCRVCRHLDIRVPEEIAIVGVDGFDISLWCEPSLTSVWLPAEEIGYQSAKLAAELFEGKPFPEENILVDGAEIIARQSTTPAKPNGLNILAALDFIEKHACVGISVDDIVSQTQGISRRTFEMRFKEWNRTTPAAAIRERKLSEAKRLLSESELSVTAIAGVCGYCNDVEFRKVFRIAEGVSPREYRKMHKFW